MSPVAEPTTVVSIEGSVASIETIDLEIQRKLRRMGFEPVEIDEDLEIFDVPMEAVEISTRGITRAERLAAMSEKDRKALGQRLQKGKAAATKTAPARRRR